ncbi:MAG TPA: hypothetical protein VHM90_09790, partial [Phycisphaerae bacterium]|nr:hypothetical protein [Phycisphaerae bacterium]
SLVPCQNCSYPRCEFRRAPFKRAQAPESEVAAAAPNDQPAATALPLLSQSPRYLINRRALERWSRDRLTLTPQSDGTTAALFRFEGTTCSNMGHPLLFHYQVTLGSREEGYPVRDMACTPAPGDDGYQFMCGYLAAPDQLMQEITQEKSLVGKSLEETLHHDRPGTAPSCYCEHDSRAHKWGLVFETIHFALVRQEQAVGVLAAKETL